jgi:hypothetical protein
MSGYGHRGSQLYFHIARYMLKRTYTWRCENTTASPCGYGGWNESEDTIELEGPGETVAGGGDSATSVGLISSSRLCPYPDIGLLQTSLHPFSVTKD